MKTVITAKEAAEMIRAGKGLTSVPAGAIVTPAAKDAFAEAGLRPRAAVASAPAGPPAEPILPDYTYRWEGRADPSTPAEIEAFFRSPEIEVLKERMCDIGRRLWTRNYTDGNGGNLVVRVGHNLYLCTQTLICKGFMEPETIGLVDGEGRQLAGTFKRTSEVLTHLAVFKNQPKARATCHAHPPHATAWAVAKVQPPTCMIPEAEVFLGQIGLAPYQTPGTPANAESVGNCAKDHHSILMVNHGVITWGDHIEDAYWKMENTESYCQTIYIAMHLSPNLSTITGGQAKELIELRAKLGMNDKRADLKECELCDNSDFSAGVVCQVPGQPTTAPSPSTPSLDPEAEALIRQITNMIAERLQTGG